MKNSNILSSTVIPETGLFNFPTLELLTWTCNLSCKKLSNSFNLALKIIFEHYLDIEVYITNMCGALRNFIPFVQCKKREKHPWRKVTFSKVAGFASHVFFSVFWIDIYLFHDGGQYHVETSPLIYSANQWTGFYMMGTFVLREFLLSRWYQAVCVRETFLTCSIP